MVGEWGATKSFRHCQRLEARGDACGILELRRPPIHRDETWARFDPLQPGPYRRELPKVKVAAVGEMGIAVERDVGDCELAGREILMGLEVIFHHLQRAVAAFQPVIQRMRLQVPAALYQPQPEIGGADLGH
jgi:hypothetical protein